MGVRSGTGRGLVDWVQISKFDMHLCGCRSVPHSIWTSIAFASSTSRAPRDAFVSTVWTREAAELLHTRRGDPAPQATWEAFMALPAIRHFVSQMLRGKIILVLGVWYGMVRMSAKSHKIHEVAKEEALLLAPLGHQLVGIHVWSEVNIRVDLSDVFEGGIVMVWSKMLLVCGESPGESRACWLRGETPRCECAI